ncbi:MAG: hypothetical protein AAGI07_16595 [Bacteroidota bacterium]
MQTLLQLIKIITPKQLSKQYILPSNISAQTKISKLYKGIYAADLTSDEQAIQEIYKGARNGKVNYRSLKRELRKRLFNNILLYEFGSDASSSSNKKQVFFDCQKTFTIAYFLILLNARNIAIPLLRDKLELMEKHEFTFLIVESIKLIRQHVAVAEGDYEKIQYYNGVLEKWLKIQSVETKVDGLYYLLMANFSRKKANKQFIYSLAKSYHNEIKYLISPELSTSVIFKSKMIEIIMYKCDNDLDKVIEICSTSIQELKNRPLPNRANIFLFYLQWMNSALQVNQTEHMKRIAEEMLDYTSLAGFNWFVAKKMAYQAAIYREAYQAAANTYCQVMKYENELKRYKILKEDWKIIALSFDILVKSKKIDTSLLEKVPNIKVAKTINELDIANKDKQGKYVSVNIFKLVNLLIKHRYEEAEEHLAAFKQYKKRHLKEEEYQRIGVFIKLVNLLLRYRFNHDLLYQWLDTSLDEFSKKSSEDKYMELIPYEQLWSFVLEAVKHKSSDTRDIKEGAKQFGKMSLN